MTYLQRQELMALSSKAFAGVTSKWQKFHNMGMPVDEVKKLMEGIIKAANEAEEKKNEQVGQS